jgi:hypothetical protein
MKTKMPSPFVIKLLCGGGISVAALYSAFTYVHRSFREGIVDALAMSVLVQMQEADRLVAKQKQEVPEAETAPTEESEFDRIRTEKLSTNRQFFIHCAMDRVVRDRVNTLGVRYPWPSSTPTRSLLTTE